MEPLTADGDGTGSLAADTVWVPIDHTSAVGAARRYATGLAERAGFGETRSGELAIAVTELAGNLHRHARDGAIALRLSRPYLSAGRPAGGSAATPHGGSAGAPHGGSAGAPHGGSAGAPEGGVDVVALDAGPGMADFEAHLRDGFSTGGTLGVGLGAVTRLASAFDAYSVPDRGTVVVARFGAERTPFTRIGSAAPPAGRVAAGLTRPMAGESACGDAFAVRPTPGGVVAVLSDGLGHGPLAARASRQAVDLFLDTDDTDVTVLLTRLHRGMRHTRGAALAVVALRDGTLSFAGLGNIAGTVTERSPSGARSRHLTSMPGIAGHQARTIRSFDYPASGGAVTVLHSDGVSSRWSFDGQWALADQDPLVVAAAVLRDAGTRRDDAGVLVLR